jgi:putative salt-induced outer membrane protein YdiY
MSNRQSLNYGAPRRLAGVRTQPRVILGGGCALLALLAASPAPGADATTNTPPKSHWESVASVDVTLTRGNSRSFLATTTLDTKGKWTADEALLGGAAGYGDTTTKDSNGQQVTTKTQDYLRGYAQWNHLFSERVYAGLRVDGLHDDIADIQYRFTLSPLAGYYLLKATNTTLSLELGPSFVDEKLDDHTDNYFGVRVGQRFEHKFKGGARAWETLEWIPQVDKFDNWILNAEAGISAPVTKSLDVRLVAQDTYNNQPAPDRLKNDLKLLAGIGYRF